MHVHPGLLLLVDHQLILLQVVIIVVVDVLVVGIIILFDLELHLVCFRELVFDLECFDAMVRYGLLLGMDDVLKVSYDLFLDLEVDL